MNKKHSKIGIVGGTHGNEWTGIDFVKNLKKSRLEHWENQFPNFDFITLFANQEAIKLNRRYVETDLNRCFAADLLANKNTKVYEHIRAQEINSLLGPKGSDQACDIIFDLHNSTANMGVTLIFGQIDKKFQQLLAYLDNEFEFVHLYQMKESPDDSPYLPTISPRDLCVEAGPLPHGCRSADLYAKVSMVMEKALSYWNQLENSEFSPEPLKANIYLHHRNVDYPRLDNGELAAMIHPSLEGKDYQEILPGHPLFQDYAGNTMANEWKEPMYPVFINEQAYYEKGIAMSLTKKVKVEW